MFSVRITFGGQNGRQVHVHPAGDTQVSLLFAEYPEKCGNLAASSAAPAKRQVATRPEINELAGDIADWLRPHHYTAEEIALIAELIRLLMASPARAMPEDHAGDRPDSEPSAATYEPATPQPDDNTDNPQALY